MSDLDVVIVATDADDEELERLTDQLRRELLQLDVEAVRRPKVGEAPPGAKGVDVVATAALVVDVARSWTVLVGVVELVQSWMAGKGARRTVKLQIDGDLIEMSHISSEDQQRLIQAWLARHAEA